MSETALTITDKDELLAQYGTDEEVHSLAARIKKTFPGGDKLSNFQLVAFAQYCRVTDVNPWRGEAYPFVDHRGQFHVIDGYKALVRWAKRQAPYSERYELLADEIRKEDIGYRCWILRQDSIPLLKALTDAGIDGSEAFKIAATSSVGVVTKEEMTSRRTGKPISPPTGWTWDERARTRALKNALNKSHGAPSPQELAEGSWMINGTKTVPDDWRLTTPDMSQYDRETIAEKTAHMRQAHENAQRAMAEGKTAGEAARELGFDWPEPEDAVWQAGEPDYAGHPMDADVYEDRREMNEADHAAEQEPRIGKDPAALITPENHWLRDETTRKRFWRYAQQDLALNREQVHEALNVESVYDFQGTKADAFKALKVYADKQGQVDANAKPAENAPEWPTQEAIDAWGIAISKAGIAPAIAKERLGVDNVREFPGTLEEAIKLSLGE